MLLKFCFRISFFSQAQVLINFKITINQKDRLFLGLLLLKGEKIGIEKSLKKKEKKNKK